MNRPVPQLPDTRTVLCVESLKKTFRNKIAVDDISFSIPPASLTVILGPAGAGKTTTLRLIAGLETPDAGRITLSGKNALPLQPKDRDVAMIFDNIALYPDKTGYQNIASPLVIRKEDKDEIDEKVKQISAPLKISHILGRLPKTMSGGEKQRIALGRALIRSPRLFLLDEPLSSLDAKLRIELRAELRRLQQELGYTFLLTTPDFQEALAIADTVLLLREGRIIQAAPPQTLYDAPVDRAAAQFIGAPQINIAEAKRVSRGNEAVLEFAGTTCPLPSGMPLLQAEQVFELGIRPENLTLAPVETAQIKGRLMDIEPLGLKAVMTIRNKAAQLRLIVENDATRGVDIGSPVGLDIVDPNALLIFNKEKGIRLSGRPELRMNQMLQGKNPELPPMEKSV